MKRSLLVFATLVFCMFGVMPAANAADVTDIPNGEEFTITLPVPTAPNGCANLPSDISGVDDIYYPYLNEMELVAKYTIFEDAEGFLIVAKLQNKYYSLNNPLAPGRSLVASFSIPRCVPVELVIPVQTPVVIPPVEPHGEPAPVDSTVEVFPITTEAPKPVEAIVTPVAVAPVVSAVEVPQAVTEPPVASEAVVVSSAPVAELAETGMKETWTVTGLVVLLTGVGLVLLSRKLAV